VENVRFTADLRYENFGDSSTHHVLGTSCEVVNLGVAPRLLLSFAHQFSFTSSLVRLRARAEWCLRGH
jgi:hypothetical protein